MRLRDLRTGEEREAAGTDVAPGTTAVRAGEVAWVSHRGETYRLSAVPRFTSRTARRSEDTPSLEAPRPGRGLGVRTAVGATVRSGTHSGMPSLCVPTQPMQTPSSLTP